jgi:hypothetical protein
MHIEDYAYAWNFCKWSCYNKALAIIPGIGIIFDISQNFEKTLILAQNHGFSKPI